MAKYQKPKYNFIEKCGLALSGIGYGIYAELHLKVHIIFSALVVALGVFFKLPKLEWTVLILSIGIVIITEIINTAIELCIDLQTKTKKMRAKLSKDLAAGAVLVASLQALLIGYLIFYDKLVILFL